MEGWSLSVCRALRIRALRHVPPSKGMKEKDIIDKMGIGARSFVYTESQ